MALVKILSAVIADQPLSVFESGLDGRIWFHAKEVCEHLKHSNPTVAMQRHVWPQYRQQMAHGKGQPAWYISEPGLYQLIFVSQTEEAIRFQAKVFEEILPSIHKYKGYIAPDATPEQVQNLCDRYLKQAEAARQLMEGLPLTDPGIPQLAKNVRALEVLASQQQRQKAKEKQREANRAEYRAISQTRSRATKK